jgi:four helix bundle protein
MKIKCFTGLTVWEKAHKLVLNVYINTKYFPDEERFGIIAQLRRSSASICANLAEGYKKSTKEFIRYLDIAEGALEETKYHLILSKDLNYLSETRFAELFNQCEEIGKMLNGLMQSLHR